MNSQIQHPYSKISKIGLDVSKIKNQGKYAQALTMYKKDYLAIYINDATCDNKFSLLNRKILFINENAQIYQLKIKLKQFYSFMPDQYIILFCDRKTCMNNQTLKQIYERKKRNNRIIQLQLSYIEPF